ncbi:MAG: restriction endonuclease subunit S [Candidatus Thorarchaeota archaeon]
MDKKDWKNVKLEVLYEFKSGLSKGKQFFGTGYPFLTYKEIFDNYFVPEKLNNLAQTSEKERINFSIRRGDVFLTRTSETVEEVGTSCVALKDYPNATFNGFAKRLRPKNKEIYPEYAVYYFRSKMFQNKAASLCSLITRASLNNDDLSYLTISYPDFQIQKKIGTILINYDFLIINNLKRINLLEKIARLIFNQWFVKFKFPGHEKAKFVDSALGEIPDGWEIIELGNKINILRGKTITKTKISPGNIPVVAAGKNPAYYHNLSNVKAPVITISASGANAGFIRLYQEDIWASDCSYIDKDTTKFIYYYYSQLKHKQIEVTALQRGSAQPHVYPKDLMRLLIVDPPEELIINFENIVKSIFNEIKKLFLKNKILKKTRDILHLKLISGQVDVSDLDIKIPETWEVGA